jgi:serine/threonine protein phosphatase PrpC
MSARWIGLCATLRGSREHNADTATCCRYKRGKKSLLGIVLCDGMGGSDIALTTAHAVRRLTEERLARLMGQMLRRRRSVNSNVQGTKELLYTIPFGTHPPGVGTTVVAGISNGRETWITWAGDSRAYVLSSGGELTCLTRDDHDSEGRLTNYAFGEARAIVLGGLHARYRRGRILAVIGTSDGVHTACSHSELDTFINWCVRGRLQTSIELASALQEFIGENLSDNSTLAIWYDRRAGRRARRGGSAKGAK